MFLFGTGFKYVSNDEKEAQLSSQQPSSKAVRCTEGKLTGSYPKTNIEQLFAYGNADVPRGHIFVNAGFKISSL